MTLFETLASLQDWQIMTLGSGALVRPRSPCMVWGFQHLPDRKQD